MPRRANFFLIELTLTEKGGKNSRVTFPVGIESHLNTIY